MFLDSLQEGIHIHNHVRFNFLKRGDVDVLVPHQPSAHGLEGLGMLLGENKHKRMMCI